MQGCKFSALLYWGGGLLTVLHRLKKKLPNNEFTQSDAFYGIKIMNIQISKTLLL